MTKSSASRKARLFERRGDKIILDRVDPHAFDGECELCHKYTELRPYGPNNENICFDCGMKNPEAAAAAFEQMLKGSGQ